MPVTYQDLTRPRGKIRPDLFPQRTADELAADVSAWIADGYAQARVQALETAAEQDAAVKAFAYHRAFEAALIDMVANPSSTSQSDAASASYSKDQRDTIARLAAEAKAEFEVLAPLLVTESPRTGGGTITHSFAW